jgi:hypothetical protein
MSRYRHVERAREMAATHFINPGRDDAPTVLRAINGDRCPFDPCASDATSRRVTNAGSTIGSSRGWAYPGPTHHSIEDVDWTRAFDGLVVVVPIHPRVRLPLSRRTSLTLA